MYDSIRPDECLYQTLIADRDNYPIAIAINRYSAG